MKRKIFQNTNKTLTEETQLEFLELAVKAVMITLSTKIVSQKCSNVNYVLKLSVNQEKLLYIKIKSMMAENVL